MRQFFACFLTLCVLCSAAAQPLNRFEPEVRAYESADRENPPPLGGVVFTGSSSFRLWGRNLEREFSSYRALNRAIGGATLPEIQFYRERLITRYRPRLVVLYVGTNDIAEAGHTPAQFAGNFRQLVESLHQELPLAHLAFVSIVTAPSRAQFASLFAEANRLVRAEVEQDSSLHYLDLTQLLLDGQGVPQEQFYLEDRLHMNPSGYRRWVPEIRALLEADCP